MDYANTTNVEFIVDPKVLFHGWLIYSYLQIFKLIKCKWLPGECADWFFDNVMTWSYCLHRRYSMSRRKNSILMVEHALNCEPVPLRPITFKFGNFINSKTLFPGWCQRLFRPQLVYVKSWKKPWKGHLIKSACVNTRESRVSIREKLHHCQRAETWQIYTRQLLQIY